MAGNAGANSSVSATGMDVRNMDVYRFHLSLRMPTPFAEKQFPIGAKLRQDEDTKKQENRKKGRVDSLVLETNNNSKNLGIQVIVKKGDVKKGDEEGKRKLAKAVIIEKTDMVTMMNLPYVLGDNYLLIGYDFSVTDDGRSTKIKLRLVKKGMKFDQPKPAEDEEGRSRQAYFHEHNRELWAEFVKWSKKMVCSIQVSKNEARVLPDHAIIQVDATHAEVMSKDVLPTQRLEINGSNAFLARIR
jgi:hypothetical protein